MATASQQAQQAGFGLGSICRCLPGSQTQVRLGYTKSILRGIAVGLAGGVLNGIIVSIVGILPFVGTLATLTVFSGLAFVVSYGRTIFGRDIPDAFGEFARGGPQIAMIDERAVV